MGKTIVLNLSHINIRGDVLDVGESFGVIYNIAKDIDDKPMQMTVRKVDMNNV